MVPPGIVGRFVTAFDAEQHPHRRRNPLTDEWVIVSPQRTRRPWQGTTAAVAHDVAHFDPTCYLCPGNGRAGDRVTPDYANTFVFDNDFPALLPDAPPTSRADGLFDIESVRGTCRVICFSPRHDETLSLMTPGSVRDVVDLWCDQHSDLSRAYRWVQVFETRGEICGVSNSHPHGQIWASDFLPTEPAKELSAQKAYRRREGSSLLVDYIEREVALGERTVEVTDEWAVVVPYWAYWPYETLVVPRRDVADLGELDDAQRSELVIALQGMLRRFDTLFAAPFPYRSGWHSAPSDSSPEDGWQLHAHYYPPLLRSATVPKVPASYEWLAGYQRDLTPELAAAHLRTLL